MESLERQLINLGYEPYEAERLYEMYEKHGRLVELRDYVSNKQVPPIPSQILDECLHLCF